MSVVARTTGSDVVRSRRVQDDLTLRNCKIIWRNFAGAEKPFNPAGKRNFSVELTDAQAKVLLEMGWMPKVVKSTADEPEPTWHLPVTVLYRPDSGPSITFITESTKNRTPIDEELVGLVDRARFDATHVTLSPYNWSVQGKSGVKAYLRTFYGVLHEDPLDLEYADYTLEGQTANLAIENVDENGVVIIEDSGWELDENERKALLSGSDD